MLIKNHLWHSHPQLPLQHSGSPSRGLLSLCSSPDWHQERGGGEFWRSMYNVNDEHNCKVAYWHRDKPTQKHKFIHGGMGMISRWVYNCTHRQTQTQREMVAVWTISIPKRQILERKDTHNTWRDKHLVLESKLEMENITNLISYFPDIQQICFSTGGTFCLVELQF